MFFLLDSTCWHLRMWMIQLNVLSSLSLITALKLDILHMKITGYCELCSNGWFTEEPNRQLLMACRDDFIPCCCFSNRKKLYLGWFLTLHIDFFFYPLLVLVHDQSFFGCFESFKAWETEKGCTLSFAPNAGVPFSFISFDVLGPDISVLRHFHRQLCITLWEVRR